MQKKKPLLYILKENDFSDFNILTEDELEKLGPFSLKNQIIYLLHKKKHILIHHGKIQEFKEKQR